jgi:GNAT superfamily N-acetyltransferase
MLHALRDADVFVAVADDEPNYVLGWIAAQTSGPTLIVHYAYVRPTYQRQGIARALLTHAGKCAEHATEAIYTNRSVKFVDEYLKRAGFFYQPAAVDGETRRITRSRLRSEG